ncbi:MAG TPA: DUF350 domain-containing protein [Azonexus sp.]
MFDPVINSLPLFAGFFATAVALLAIFAGLYLLVTPYSEVRLIRTGNTAAAVSLAGALLGYALPIAVAVAVSHDIYVMIGWGVVAGLVQLLVYVTARLALPQINLAIAQGQLASGIFLGALAIAVGILNAGCIL